MGIYFDKLDLYNILTKNLKLDEVKSSIFISAIKQLSPDIYTKLEQELRIQAQDSKKDIHDLHNKILVYSLFQFYINVYFILVILYFIK